jgi:nucleoside-diphosphate-sugar epimerase
MVHKVNRAFVTGACGFVGRALLEYLNARHISITALSRSTDSDIAILKVAPLATICRGGTSSVLSMEQAMQGCDCVFNCAAKTQRHGSWWDYVEGAWGSSLAALSQLGQNDAPMLDFLIFDHHLHSTDTVEGARDVATAAAKAGVKRLIHVSASLELLWTDG